MSRFVAWNNLLLSEFFSEAAENEEVWIRATRAELDSFGLHLGGARGLIDAVGSGPPWVPNGPNCANTARILVQQRRDPLRTLLYEDPGASNPRYARVRAPAYLPILALWVLAASGEQLEHGFYASVQRLLGPQFKSEPRITEAMSKAWEDLEAWSCKECAGRFGNFHYRVLGEHRFVGIARSQCLVSRQDERNLYRLFWEARLRPGQELSDSTLTSLLERGRNAPYLTRPLCIAMAEPAYVPQLAALLRKLLRSWSGSKPNIGHADAENRSAGPLVKEQGQIGAAVTLVLSPSDEVPNGWDVRWSFPAVVDAPRCCFEIAGQRQPAFLHRASATFLTDLSESSIRHSVAALSSSSLAQVAVQVRFEDDSVGTCGDQYRVELISRASRRILVWNSIDPRLGQQLIEREIPLYGVFYLVCSSVDWTRTGPWLQRERISFEPMQACGLPDGWQMACVHRAEHLSTQHRQHLADAPEATDVPPARLKLVGGSRLLRGGTRLFASYDLPDIEVEAPSGTLVESPGLTLLEVPQHLASDGRSGVRRFVVNSIELTRSSFDISIVSNGIGLASLRLRVADPDGEGRGESRPFSLDPLGFPTSNLGGLRGITIGGGCQDPIEGGWQSEEMLEAAASLKRGSASVEDSIAAKFLDTLAARGSMSYGTARDQLLRLSEDALPIALLMDLRARGCLEIEADGKGHFVRIHSVAPSLYALPATQEGLPLFGVSGTLRLAQWALLQGNADFLATVADAAAGHLPMLRVAAIDALSVQAACSSMGFDFAPSPARDVARWAESLRHARGAAESRGTESVTAELGHLHRLKADSARFVPASEPRMSIDQECGAQLFRFDDPQAAALQLYVLGVRRPDGASRYSHVPDSRWGVWISQLAFAEMLKDKHGRTDAFPWPLHYDPETRDFWVPARLRPPAVLERALALCSGAGPETHSLSPSRNADGALAVFDNGSGHAVGTISHMYGEFVPGYWLRYQWVPAETARQVAGLLGCILQPFACLGVARGSETMTN